MINTEITNKIKNVEVVSFDIFDTLLIRPYIKPTDLFLQIDDIYDIKFSKYRKLAEKKAWKNLRKQKSDKEDINIYDIYKFMPKNLQNYLEKEIDLEKKILIKNPETIEILEFAKNSGKKIIITSDMYLPENIIIDILNINNIYYDKLYLSNVFSKRKDSGNLYKFIQKELDIPYNKIFHIGDNEYSDVKIPKNLGIITEKYTNIIKEFFAQNSKYELFYKKNLSASISFLLASGIFSYYFYKYFHKNTNYWSKIGCTVGGPICFAYLNKISQSAKMHNINNLLFIARDGYTLQKIYDMCFKLDENTKYIYAPRNIKHFIDNNKEQALINEYSSYVQSLNINNANIGIIDTISNSLSAQTLIEKFSNSKKIIGYYFAILNKKKENIIKNKNFESFLPVMKKLSYANFIEFLISAPEKPIKWVEHNKPIYDENLSEYEKTKIELYSTISEAEIEYAKFITPTIKNIELPYSEKDIDKFIKFFENNPTEENIQEFKQIKNGIDTNNSNYVYIFPEWYYKKYKIFNIPIITIKENYKKLSIKFFGIKIWSIKFKK